MKTRLVAVSRSCCLAAAGLALLVASEARALDMIDPTGAIYSNITNSSQFSTGFVATNLFSQNLTGVTVGQTVTGAEWAKSGSGSAYVAFRWRRCARLQVRFRLRARIGSRSDAGPKWPMPTLA